MSIAEAMAKEIGPIIRDVVRGEIASLAEINQPLAYSEADAAKLLGVPIWTLIELRKKAKIKAVRAGRHWIYARSDLLFYLEGAH
jgi:hypothetical protein